MYVIMQLISEHPTLSCAHYLDILLSVLIRFLLRSETLLDIFPEAISVTR